MAWIVIEKFGGCEYGAPYVMFGVGSDYAAIFQTEEVAKEFARTECQEGVAVDIGDL